jgi:hypothetical protein
VAVAVVNPARAREFAKALGRLAKTDAVDAAILAEFAERVRPPVRLLPDAEARKMQALLARWGNWWGCGRWSGTGSGRPPTERFAGPWRRT